MSSNNILSTWPFDKINDALMILSQLPKDLTIMSASNEEIHVNKHLLILYSHTLRQLIGDRDDVVSVPGCSVSFIRQFVKIISGTGINSDPLPLMAKGRGKSRGFLNCAPTVGSLTLSTDYSVS